MARRSAAPSSIGAKLGFEEQLWQMADALRGALAAADFEVRTAGLKEADAKDFERLVVVAYS